MTDQRMMRLAFDWAEGRVCTLKEGEAKEYHEKVLRLLVEVRQLRYETEWKDAETDPPTEAENVLAAHQKGVTVARYAPGEGGSWIGLKSQKLKTVDYWLPLPGLPAKEKEI